MNGLTELIPLVNGLKNQKLLNKYTVIRLIEFDGKILGSLKFFGSVISRGLFRNFFGLVQPNKLLVNQEEHPFCSRYLNDEWYCIQANYLFS